MLADCSEISGEDTEQAGAEHSAVVAVEEVRASECQTLLL